jgi:hypothetical protein
VSPFRHILKRSGAEHPIGYSLLMLSAAMIVCMLTAVTISIRAGQQAIHQSERRQCESLWSDVQAYREVPPTTSTGRNQMRSKMELLKIWGCPDPPEKRPADDQRRKDDLPSRSPGS